MNKVFDVLEKILGRSNFGLISSSCNFRLVETKYWYVLSKFLGNLRAGDESSIISTVNLSGIWVSEREV